MALCISSAGVADSRANWSNCAAYALAWLRREPLLFKGADFARTDVTPALAQRTVVHGGVSS